MLEARRRHRHLREKQRGAVATRRGPGYWPPAAAAAPQDRPATFVARMVMVRALQVLAAVALSQLGYRLASWLALPVPGSVVAVGMLFSLLSNQLVPARWFDKAVALLIKHLPTLVILVAVGILMFGDLVTARGLAIALTLLGSAIAGLAINIGSRRIMARWQSRCGARMRVLASLSRTMHSAVGSIQGLVAPIRLAPF
jgi:holin-like protein